MARGSINFQTRFRHYLAQPRHKAFLLSLITLVCLLVLWRLTEVQFEGLFAFEFREIISALTLVIAFLISFLVYAYYSRQYQAYELAQECSQWQKPVEKTRTLPQAGPENPVDPPQVDVIQTFDSVQIGLDPIGFPLEILPANQTQNTNDEKFRSLVENTHELITRFDRECRYLYANPAAKVFIPSKSDEFIGKSHRELGFPEEEVRFWEACIHSVLESRLPQEFELELNTSHGLRVFSWHLFPEFDPSGKVTSVVTTARDITERKLAQEALVNSELKFRRLIASSTEGVVISDEQGIVIEWNESQEQITGLPREEVIGLPIWDVLFHLSEPEHKMPVFYEILRSSIEATLHGEHPLSTEVAVEHQFIHPDGTQRTVESRTFPIPTERGYMIGSINHDITRRKQSNEQLRLQNLALEAALNGIVIADHGGVIQWVNPAFTVVTGYDSQESIGRSINFLFSGTQDPAIHQNMWQTVQAGKVWKGEIINQRKDGTLYNEDMTITPVRAGGSEITHLIAIKQDISERKQTDIKIQKQIQHLIALRAVDTAINASLDLRVTLNVLLEHLVAQLEIHATGILLINPHTQMLEYTASRGFRTAAPQHIHLRLGEGPAGQAALRRRTIQINNLAEEDSGIRMPFQLTTEGFVTCFSIPLISKGRVVGVLETFHRNHFNAEPEWLELLEAYATQAAIAIDNAQILEELQRSNTELSLAYDATIEGWSRALDLRDKETEGHSRRVTLLTLRLARNMGVTDADLVHIRRGALLHDIGKVSISDSILLKPGPLTAEEMAIMRKHPVHAYELMSTIVFLRPSLDIPYYHHEKWDGSGYPRGLKGNEIPLAARIFAVVDVWDALLSARPYRPPMSRKDAFQYVVENKGTHFDPRVVDEFIRILEENPDFENDL